METGIRGAQWLIVIGILTGLVFIVTGAIITGIAYTEITPPDYDDNYYRYIGSSVQRLVGPFILAFGFFLLIGSCGFFGWQFYRSNKEPEYHAPKDPRYFDDEEEIPEKGQSLYD